MAIPGGLNRHQVCWSLSRSTNHNQVWVTYSQCQDFQTASTGALKPQQTG